MSKLFGNLEEIHKDFQLKVSKIKSSEDLQGLRVSFLGKKGVLTESLKAVGTLPEKDRPVFGQKVNVLRAELEEVLDTKQKDIESLEVEKDLAQNRLDVTMPGVERSPRTLHPLTQVQNRLVQIFTSLGFSIEEGPDIESDYYNFEALNFPLDHPARDMQDTFFVSNQHVLRTHTSPVQVRMMESQAPPIQMITPGRVYRHDADTTHSPVFHQIEGLCIGPNITFAHLKGTLEAFVEMMFGKDTKVRFRPSFFPFTEPSAEMDVMGPLGSWMEILGCGMVDPNVFENIAKAWALKHPDQKENPYEAGKVTGFAFGLGIERIAMIHYGIKDIRLFYENDLRFLHQF